MHQDTYELELNVSFAHDLVHHGNKQRQTCLNHDNELQHSSFRVRNRELRRPLPPLLGHVMLINDGHCHSIIPTVIDSGNWSLIGTRCHRKSSPTPTRNQCSNIMIHHNFVIRLSILLIVSLFLNYSFICPNIAFILTDWHRIIDSDVDIGVSMFRW